MYIKKSFVFPRFPKFGTELQNSHLLGGAWLSRHTPVWFLFRKVFPETEKEVEVL